MFYLVDIDYRDIEHRPSLRKIRKSLTDHVILAFKRGIDLPRFAVEGHRAEMALDTVDRAKHLALHVCDDEGVSE